MSQVNGAGVSLSTSITPWNRTPGKPGTGTNNVSSLASSRWNNKATSNLTTDTCHDTPLEGKSNYSKGNFRRLLEHTEQSVVGTSEGGQMWPPPMFDTARVTDPTAGAFAANMEVTSCATQWSIPDFSGAVGSTSLLGEPGSTTAPSGAAWSMQANSTISSVPRAITGQQSHSNLVADSDPTRRYLSGSRANAWPLSSDSPEFPGDDRVNLPLAFSKLNVAGTVPSTGCFQPIQEFADGQLLTCSVTSNSKSGDLSTDPTGSQKTHKKSSIDSAEVEALFATDPEEAVRSIVNTTEPWGIHPVDQSTPWDTSELNDVGHTTACGSPSADVANAAARGASGVFDSQTSTVQQPRRIGALSGSTLGRDVESNVWPSEPPTGTGIWESHYENLGERTARWQPNAGSSMAQPGFASLSGTHPGFVGPNSPSSRPQLPPGSEGGAVFRGYNRSTSGLLPSGMSNPAGLGTRPVVGAPHAIGTPLHNTSTSTGSNRGFPMASSPNLATPNGPWPFPSSATPGDNSAPGVGLGNKGRWPNAHFNRLAGKQQQQQTFPHLLSNPNGTGMRWPPFGNVPQVQGGWPLTDPRRPNLMPGGWSNPPATETSGYFNQPHPILPPRMCQPGSVATDFPTPVVPPPRNATGGPNQQPFRTPPSAFYPALNSGISPSSSAAQRMFLSPQQHSQQLQQQSVLRANAMRQLVNLGFAEEEVQAIFSDINTNVERALMDLRDRTCHPGLDEMIKSFTNSGLMQLGNLDDAVNADQLPGNRTMNLRSSQHPSTYDQSMPKPNLSAAGLPAENLELSLHVLQQRETQILQTIMQLQAKHQELNGKLKQIRSANLPFATNPVMQELQLQAIQVASQIEAQHAQLKHVRSQAGMIKQITASTNMTHSSTHPPPQQQNAFNPVSSTGNFNFLASGGWPSTNPTPMGGGPQRAPQMLDHITGSDQLLDASNMQDSGLKMGSGAFFWESNPWSGPGPRASVDPYSTGVDRRWSSSTYPNRPPYGALGDPRWSDLGGGDPGGGILSSDPQRPYGDSGDEPAGDVRQSVSRSWLLVHNIPPHVSVGVLKLAVSNALSKHIKATTGSDNINGTQPDFELHPHMAARWVLLGFSTASEASMVQECLESAGGEQNGAHYGSVKPIPPGEVLLRLQDIQSLVSRFKGIGADSATSTGNLRCSVQASSVLSYGSSGPGAIGSGDVSAVAPTGSASNSTDISNTNETT